ncbi:MAG: hypothetical protein EXS37_17880 [Opitutus sp.]|nr:hypothetical protein [Opitutus sp.]
MYSIFRFAVVGLLATVLRADLRVVGSDLLGLEFTRAFYEFSGRNGLPLALALDGSRPGWEEFKAGRADLALIVLPPEEAAPLASFRTRPLGYHSIVVLVPADCPLERITLAQLAAVFGTNAEAGSRAGLRWSELGVAGEWGGAFVAAVAPESGEGITTEYFRAAVLRGRELKSNVQRYAAGAELLRHFGGDSRAMALAPMAPAGAKNIKVLRVAAGVSDAGVAPTPETLHAATYPLRLPLQLVFRPDRAPALTRLFEFLFGEIAAQLLERAGVTPLPALVRQAQLPSTGPGEKTRK